jgi:hypothetical protein
LPGHDLAPNRKIDMKLNKIAIWSSLFATLLFILAGLRDWFAPGFFNNSPQIPSKGQIISHFVLAIVFLALAISIKMRGSQDIVKK